MQPRWRDNRTNTHRSGFKLLTGEVKIISVQREEVQTNSGGCSCSVMARATWQRALLWSFPVLFCRFSPHTSCCALLPVFVLCPDLSHLSQIILLCNDIISVHMAEPSSVQRFVYINEIKEGNHSEVYASVRFINLLTYLSSCTFRLGNL